MHDHERQTALAFIRQLAGNGLLAKETPTYAQGWGDRQLRPYFEAANGFLEDITGATGMRGEYDDDGLAEELDEVIKAVGAQHDERGGVARDARYAPVQWMYFIVARNLAICGLGLADEAFATEMRRIAALAISAALAHRYARAHPATLMEPAT